MQLILFAAAAFIVGVSVLGLHNSVSNQSSKSAVSETLDNIEKSKEELDQKIKTQLFLGTVTIIAKIANWQNGRAKAQKEKINAIENANGGAATAIGMNITLDAIQAIGDSISDIVAIPDVGSSIPPLIPPVIPDVGPISSPLIPPSIPNDGPISNPLTPPDVAPPGAPPLVPPKLDPPGIPPFIPPAVGSKGLEDYINWAKKSKSKTETEIPPQRYVGSNEEKVKTSREGLNQLPEISKLARDNGAKKDNTRFLDDDEKEIANKLLDELNTMRQAELDGDTATVDRIQDEFIKKYRQHPLKDDYNGWTSLDLTTKNSGLSNINRLLYKEVSYGIDWKIVRMH